MAQQTISNDTFTWRADAQCSSPEANPLDEEIFFEYSNKVEKAKRICENCSVLQNCLEWGLTVTGLQIHLVIGILTLAERITTAEQLQIAA